MNIADYKSEDFAHMLFPFFSIGEADVFETFPILSKYKEFNERLHGIRPSRVIKYIGYCYDKGSPLQKIEDIVDKKVTAALLAGFVPLENGTFDSVVDDMFRGKITAINLMIIRYCRLVRSRTYMVLAVGNETLHNIIKELMAYKPSGDDVLKETQLKMKMLTEAKELANELDELSLELLSGDNNIQLNGLLYAVSDMTEEEYISLSAEDFADKWLTNHPSITANINESDNEVSVPSS